MSGLWSPFKPLKRPNFVIFLPSGEVLFSVHLLVEVDAAEAANGRDEAEGVKDPVKLNLILKVEMLQGERNTSINKVEHEVGDLFEKW